MKQHVGPFPILRGLRKLPGHQLFSLRLGQDSLLPLGLNGGFSAPQHVLDVLLMLGLQMLDLAPEDKLGMG
eukprot:8761588-Alexandrium_andersonii.AAC.1